MWAVETAASLQSVAPSETGLEQLSSSLEFSMREMAPSLFRLLQVGHKLLCFVPFVTDARQQSDPDKKNSYLVPYPSTGRGYYFWVWSWHIFNASYFWNIFNINSWEGNAVLDRFSSSEVIWYGAVLRLWIRPVLPVRNQINIPEPERDSDPEPTIRFNRKF